MSRADRRTSAGSGTSDASGRDASEGNGYACGCAEIAAADRDRAATGYWPSVRDDARHDRCRNNVGELVGICNCVRLTTDIHNHIHYPCGMSRAGRCTSTGCGTSDISGGCASESDRCSSGSCAEITAKDRDRVAAGCCASVRHNAGHYRHRNKICELIGRAGGAYLSVGGNNYMNGAASSRAGGCTCGRTGTGYVRRRG
jgi:hypothetical protein